MREAFIAVALLVVVAVAGCSTGAVKDSGYVGPAESVRSTIDLDYWLQAAAVPPPRTASRGSVLSAGGTNRSWLPRAPWSSAFRSLVNQRMSAGY